jgi:hypothetical protein
MAEEETISGLRLLRAAATPALANYVNDHFAMIGFQAYLWKMVVTVDDGHGDPAKFPAPGEPAPPESAVGQMTSHSQYLNEMTFCRGVNSFQTYLAELLTLIFEARPETLKSQKMVTREFCVEHYAANHLIAALAKQTVDELAYRSLKDAARFFEKTLRLPLFTKKEDLEKTALHVDIRNVITHNRGISIPSSSSVTPSSQVSWAIRSRSRRIVIPASSWEAYSFSRDSWICGPYRNLACRPSSRKAGLRVANEMIWAEASNRRPNFRMQTRLLRLLPTNALRSGNEVSSRQVAASCPRRTCCP